MVRVGSNHEKFRNYFRASISQKKDLYNFRHLRSRWGKNRWSESEAVSSTVEATHVRKNTVSASALLDLLWIKHDKVPSSWPFRWTKSGEEPSRHYKCITTPPPPSIQVVPFLFFTPAPQTSRVLHWSASNSCTPCTVWLWRGILTPSRVCNGYFFVLLCVLLFGEPPYRRSLSEAYSRNTFWRDQLTLQNFQFFLRLSLIVQINLRLILPLQGPRERGESLMLLIRFLWKREIRIELQQNGILAEM